MRSLFTPSLIRATFPRPSTKCGLFTDRLPAQPPTQEQLLLTAHSSILPSPFFILPRVR
jgi:hypothetical protein